MPMLTLALISGACAFVYVAWASWVGGYPVELALARGVIGFMALALIGFVAELTVATVHPAEPRRPVREPIPLRPAVEQASEQTDAPEEEEEAARAA